jgi:hypothetical protein
MESLRQQGWQLGENSATSSASTNSTGDGIVWRCRCCTRCAPTTKPRRSSGRLQMYPQVLINARTGKASG